MGALIAGVAISTFPYNLDVIAKVVNIRDFFVTLFFVSLGMKIPNPFADSSLLLIAAAASAFLIASRFITVFPVLYILKNGFRVSLLTANNLAQMSEFSLVIAALGVSAGHISQDTLSVIIFIFVITSIISTYMIKYDDYIQKFISVILKKTGLKDLHSVVQNENLVQNREIAVLGFHRTASSFLHEILSVEEDWESVIKEKLVVVDFNPEIHKSLQTMGVKVVYGDISHMDTLHHAGLDDVKIVISTVPDTILVGTDNLKIVRQMKEICPHAKIIVTAESTDRALKMYNEGADYVIVPRVLAAKKIASMVKMMLNDTESATNSYIENEIEILKNRMELIK
jgi:voltage-gated potassium channel Kch